jgi:hypothetical protein
MHVIDRLKFMYDSEVQQIISIILHGIMDKIENNQPHDVIISYIQESINYYSNPENTGLYRPS